jgi:hypothetical protein
MTDQPSARLRLAAELAVGLARRLSMTLHYDATDAGFCWHMFQSTFVEGCYVLWELGVALAGTGRGDDQGMTRQQCIVYAKQHPGDKRFDLDQQSLFKFFPASETRAGVLAYGELPDALFQRLLRHISKTRASMAPMERNFVQVKDCSGRRLSLTARSTRSSSADTLNVVGPWSSGLTKPLL